MQTRECRIIKDAHGTYGMYQNNTLEMLSWVYVEFMDDFVCKVSVQDKTISIEEKEYYGSNSMLIPA